jgi:hypothetical protein
LVATGRSLLPKLLPDGAERRNTNQHRPLRSGIRGAAECVIEAGGGLLALDPPQLVDGASGLGVWLLLAV